MHNHEGIRPLPPHINQWYCAHFFCDNSQPLKSENSASTFTHNLSPKTCWYLHSKITTEINWTILCTDGTTTVFWESLSVAYSGTRIRWIPTVTCRRMECKCTAHSGAGEEHIYIYMTFGILSITLCRTSYIYITFGSIRSIYTKIVLLFIGISMFQVESY